MNTPQFSDPVRYLDVTNSAQKEGEVEACLH